MNKIIGLIAGILFFVAFMFGFFYGQARADSGLTTSQVNSIIGLLQAFGVDQATINQVYGELVPPTVSGSVVINPPVSSSQISTSTMPIIEAPTCTITAYAGVIKPGVYQTHVSWDFTPGASATLSAGGSQVNINWPTSTIVDTPGATFVTTLITSDTDYEMDVTKNGVLSNCLAHVTVPTSN